MYGCSRGITADLLAEDFKRSALSTHIATLME
jgi:hypothetical protein